ncbi:MAG: glycogen synthase GlgA [Bryobacteraceae bacterium]
MSRILMVSSEAAPYAKTGGLADVVGALPAALTRFGHEVTVLIPRYAAVQSTPSRRVWDALPIWIDGIAYPTSLFAPEDGGPVLFLDCPPLYSRPGLYGDPAGDYPDNAIRFAVLCRAALEVARHVFRPNLIHCHDWQTGLIPAYLKTTFANDPTFFGIRTLFTIHNLGYQGIFARAALAQIGLSADLFRPDRIEFWGDIGFLKAGLVYSDAISTVSPRYAEEIQTPEYGHGLDDLLRERRADLTGILNGVDYRHWNPETDHFLPANYSAKKLDGKKVCKRELLREFGLPPAAIERPLVGIVSRLTGQKGADLIAGIAGPLFEEDVSLVVLGSGEARYESLFRRIAQAHPDRVGVFLGYNDGLAHRIEAGSDMFLMPSRYEPCGLNQIYSLRYGTVPIVRATGGLDDTIEEGTGFKFREYSGEALLGAIRAACRAFRKRGSWTETMRRGMAKDFSWDASARQYSGLYARLLNPGL